jgi:serine/threonine protein kinase
VTDDLTNALSERYELRNVLGRGGMATVYLSYDRKHLREVALKMLRPEIAASRTLEDLADRLASMTRGLVGEPRRLESPKPAL